jgi:hypothetical protein
VAFTLAVTQFVGNSLVTKVWPGHSNHFYEKSLLSKTEYGDEEFPNIHGLYLSGTAYGAQN